MIGVIQQSHPYGATTATEYLWDDAFIEECLIAENITDEEFERLSSYEQNKMLKSYAALLYLERGL